MIQFWFGLAVLTVVAIWFSIRWVVESYHKFMKWRATGYCKHKFALYSTHSWGSYATYKCVHCQEKRVMRL